MEVNSLPNVPAAFIPDIQPLTLTDEMNVCVAEQSYKIYSRIKNRVPDRFQCYEHETSPGKKKLLVLTQLSRDRP